MIRLRGGAPAAAVALVLLSLLFVYGHTREDSLSADEPIHILSGYLAVSASNAIVNVEHPPLMKALAGLALQALPLPPPPERVPLGETFTAYGHALLFENRVSADTIAAAARAPFLLVLALLLLFVFAAARARYGGAAALFSLALLAFDPNLLAHAGVVHTDLGGALAFPASVLAWERARRHPTAARLAVAALVLGLSFATKFSTVYLAPILLLQTLLAARREPRPGRETGLALARLGLVGVGALAVVFLVYAAVTRNMDAAVQKQVLHEMVALRGAPGLSRAIESLASFSPPLAHYAGGLASVFRQNVVGGGVSFLLGEISTRGFPFYFFVAFPAKSTLAFLAVALAVLVTFFRTREGREEGRLFLLPVAVLFLASIASSYNIGIRHLLPVYPFLALAGAGLFSRLWARRKEGRAARALASVFLLLPLLSFAELLRIHPHELSYFNPLAGGPEAGRKILSDSNVDWGLDLKRLARELTRRRVSGPTVVYFGGDDVSGRIGVPDFSAEPRLRGGLVAFSAFHLAVGPEYYAYHGAPAVGAALAALRREALARGRPAGRVGYSLYFFELPPESQRTLSER